MKKTENIGRHLLLVIRQLAVAETMRDAVFYNCEAVTRYSRGCQPVGTNRNTNSNHEVMALKIRQDEQDLQDEKRAKMNRR